MRRYGSVWCSGSVRRLDEPTAGRGRLYVMTAWWQMEQASLHKYPRKRASVRQLPPRPRPTPTALSFLHARPAIWRRRPRTRRRTRDLIASFGRRRRTRSSAVCARLAQSRSWGAHSNEGSTLSRPSGYILGRVTSLAM